MDYFINIDSICDVDKTQIREGYDNGVIADLSLMFADAGLDKDEIGSVSETAYPENLPPIAVVPAPGNKGKYWIVDGHHRYKAAKNTGKEKVKVDILIPAGFSEPVNDLDDLRFLQAAENAEAVANRTVETRRRQVKAAIKKRPDWRTFQIARYCHVSYDLVNSVWAELEAQDEAQKPKKPIEKAAEAISKPENAGKSNVEIAKAAGVDEGTIRKARKISDRKNSEVEVRENSDRKNPAPQTTEGNRLPKDFCASCFDGDESKLMVYDWNGEKLCFCSEECANDFAEEHEMEADHVNRMFIEKDFDAQLDKVASKAEASLKAAGFVEVHPDSIPIRDNANIEWIVDDVLDWLKDRADVFAVLLRDRIENGN